ncbi:hypothetical protein [Mycobacterium sp. E787]|uniref:hypothetical protein n=1 Tax=Mycobacterium sp. E787 TaxID=1834150 RepID=UPI0007FD9352|nr:hypothetical protein [Mycobacterium sp. E787]OBI52874.1 hypothetical protein A5705_04880 [Mycobacterium sp. E787]
MTAVRFGVHGAVYVVQFSYDPAVIDLIKATVPHYARSWHPTAKAWTVEAGWARPLAAMLRRRGHVVAGIDDPTQHHHDTDPATWAQLVFQRVGPARAPLAYRLLSRVCHPDHGGDHQLQVELNRAFAELPSKRRTA